MSPIERQDWFSLARSVARCRSFDIDYYKIEGISEILPRVGGSKTEAANTVFEYCEDYIDTYLNPKAVCNFKLANSEICSCEWIDGFDGNCVENYHLDVFPNLTLTIGQLVAVAEKISKIV